MAHLHCHLTPIERFWARVNKEGGIHREGLTECWIWLGQLDEKGYGRFRVLKSLVRVHRYSYEIHVGSITSSICVLHKCDNRRCVNPDHLFLGDNKANTLDMCSKNRQAKGETNGVAVLNEHLVNYIRIRYVPRCRINGARAIARDLGISHLTVLGCMNGRCWNHV